MFHLIFFIICSTVSFQESFAIFGGEDGVQGQFPYIVAFLHPQTLKQICDGIIIDKSWILTSGQCSVYTKLDYLVLTGTHVDSPYTGTLFNIKEIIQHDNYKPTNFENDIALIHLDGELSFDNMTQPIELVHVEENQKCSVIGFGSTEAVEFPEYVQYIEETTINLDLCKDYAKNMSLSLYLGEEQVCALGDMGKGFCIGDFGGPLVCNGKLAGIISYFIYPCGRGFPDVFLRPDIYQEWIHQTIASRT